MEGTGQDMRRRLQQLLNETFEYSVPRMLLSGRRITLSARQGENCRGAFLVSHPRDGKVRGFLYASGPRIRFESEEFFGHENAVRFEVDMSGLLPGEETEEVITVCTDLGEEEVKVVAGVLSQREEETAPDLGELADMARQDWDQARNVMDSKAFCRKMEREDESVRSLFQALSGEENRSSALEEFLIGCGMKESVEIGTDWTEKKIEDPEGTARESVMLTASTWGYLDIEISSDARFLRPEKRQLQTGEFAGGQYELGIIIDSNFLHAGRNYGRILIRTSYQSIALTVRVDRMRKEDHRQHRVRQLMRKRAVELYVDYRCGRIDLRSWVERTESVLNGYRRAGGMDVCADLLLAFVMQADGRKVQGEKILQRIREKDLSRLTAENYALWLYLSTFFTRDAAYINRVRVEIRRLRAENRSSWQIRWICMNLFDSEYATDAARLEAVLEQIALGCSSPVMYLEGALILEQNPYLFHEITPSMRLLLNYASRHGMMSEQLVLELSSMEKRKPKYDSLLFCVLSRYWKTSGIRDVLEAMCAMAISGRKNAPAYHELYRAAVTREITATGLYEFYLETMEECRIETMPEVIRRYFLCSTTLNWKKRAMIYRSISQSRERIPQIFRSMRGPLEKFLIDQLAQGHISEDLAVLYDEYLNEKMLTPRLGGNLARMLFTYRITVLNPNMKGVLTCDCRMDRSRSAEVADRTAQVRILSDSTRILLRDEKGGLHASTSLYQAQPLLSSPGLMRMCMKTAPEAPALSLFFSLNPVSEKPVTGSSLPYFLDAEKSSLLSSGYRGKIREWLLQYYTDHPEEKTRYHFLKAMDCDAYARAGAGTLAALLTRQGFYEQAYGILLAYGCEHVRITDSVRIISQTILQQEYEEDRRLLACASWCFFSGKYDEHIVSYLLLYYDGPAGNMKTLWKTGKQYGLDTMGLEKKLLSLLIFEQQQTEESEEIYLSYRSSLGSRKLCQAYVILRSWQYLVKGQPLSEPVFDDMAADAQHGGRLPDVCALALLLHLSRKSARTQQEDETARRLLCEYDERGIRFAFFRQFPAEVTGDIHLEDRVFLEVTADPDSVVRVLWREKGSQEPFAEEVMRDVKYGIRVKEFILFGKQEVECRTEEIRKDGTHILSGMKVLKAGQMTGRLQDSAYGRISEIEDAYLDGRLEDCRQKIREYRQNQEMVRELFTLI